MKKLVSLLLAFSMLLGYSTALASDLGVQVIGGPDTAFSTMSLDDMQVGQTYTIDGYAMINIVDAKFIDYFAQFDKDSDYKTPSYTHNGDYVFTESKILEGKSSYFYKKAAWMDSGVTADFFWLQIDITNLQKKPVTYSGEITIKVIYNDNYEFAGWIRQADFDINRNVYRLRSDTLGNGAAFAVLNPANEKGIEMMYTGSFVFGCTLPNSVVTDKAPLRMEINLGGNELTFNIRK